MTSNQETAQLLKRVAAVFRVKEGDTFRVKAYNNAATAIENSSESIYELWQQGLLDTIPGIGESLKKYLSEYFKKGRVRHFESVFKKVPAGMFSLMEIRGVGPITAYKIAKKFKLTDTKTAKDKLQKILKEGRLEEIEGFKEKTAAKIQKSIDIKSEAKIKRMLLLEGLNVADKFLEYLKQSPDIKNAEPLGSMRRRVPTVGDIDIAISSSKPQFAMEYALSYPEIAGVITKGDKLSHVKLKNGYEVDIKLSLPEEWGSLLQHYTGSKMHNIHLRTIALDKGLSLSEYGIKDSKNTNQFTDEQSFYNFLGMQYIPPEMREDKGEIELAIKKQVPDLIELSDIKGDLHLHSNFDYPSSHDIGVNPLRDLLDFAMDHNYQYLGISDHNPKFSGLSDTERRNIIKKRNKFLQDEYRAYENRVKNCTVKLLMGMEVDIRPDGGLALDDESLKLLDYAIVSVHSSFVLDTESNTKRIISGLSHPKSKILGHPTGRMLNDRDPMNVNWDTVFKFCVQNKKILEINASPYRLDLPDDLIRQAQSMGLSFVINTDSHSVREMSLMNYGVWQAKRGWLNKKQVLNTLSYKDLQAMINL